MPVEIAPPQIDTEPGTTEIPEPTHERGRSRIHYVTRSNAVHAVCGVRVVDATEAEQKTLPVCGDCVRILNLWIDHGVWEGYGPPPGKANTEDLRVWMNYHGDRNDA